MQRSAANGGARKRKSEEAVGTERERSSSSHERCEGAGKTHGHERKKGAYENTTGAVSANAGRHVQEQEDAGPWVQVSRRARTSYAHKASTKISADEARHLIGAGGRTLARLRAEFESLAEIHILGGARQKTRKLAIRSKESQAECNRALAACRTVIRRAMDKERAATEAEQAADKAERVAHEKSVAARRQRLEEERTRREAAQRRRAVGDACANAIATALTARREFEAASANLARLRVKFAKSSAQRAEVLEAAEKAAAEAAAVVPAKPKGILQARTFARQRQKRLKAEEAEAQARGDLEGLLARRAAKEKASKDALELPEVLRKQFTEQEREEQVVLAQAIAARQDAQRASLEADKNALALRAASASIAAEAEAVAPVVAAAAQKTTAARNNTVHASPQRAAVPFTAQVELPAKRSTRLDGDDTTNPFLRRLRAEHPNVNISFSKRSPESTAAVSGVVITVTTKTNVSPVPSQADADAAVAAALRVCFPDLYVACATVPDAKAAVLLGPQGKALDALKARFTRATVRVTGARGEPRTLSAVAASQQDADDVVEHVAEQLSLCITAHDESAAGLPEANSSAQLLHSGRDSGAARPATTTFASVTAMASAARQPPTRKPPPMTTLAEVRGVRSQVEVPKRRATAFSKGSDALKAVLAAHPDIALEFSKGAAGAASGASSVVLTTRGPTGYQAEADAAMATVLRTCFSDLFVAVTTFSDVGAAALLGPGGVTFAKLQQRHESVTLRLTGVRGGSRTLSAVAASQQLADSAVDAAKEAVTEALGGRPEYTRRSVVGGPKHGWQDKEGRWFRKSTKTSGAAKGRMEELRQDPNDPAKRWYTWSDTTKFYRTAKKWSLEKTEALWAAMDPVSVERKEIEKARSEAAYSGPQRHVVIVNGKPKVVSVNKEGSASGGGSSGGGNSGRRASGSRGDSGSQSPQVKRSRPSSQHSEGASR